MPFCTFCAPFGTGQINCVVVIQICVVGDEVVVVQLDQLPACGGAIQRPVDVIDPSKLG
jgi:hypothetical protein